MAVNTSESQKSFDGNGVSTSFSFGFPFFSKDDIVVVLYDSDGNGTVQSIGTNYTIPGSIWITGGEINMVSPPSIGETLVVSRIVDYLQEFGFRNLGQFRAEIHEDAFDKIVMMIQQLYLTSSKSLIVGDLYQGEKPIVIPNPIDGNILRWKQGGNGFENFDSDAAYVNVSGDTMLSPLAGPPSVNPTEYMPQYQVAEVVDDRIESIPGFDPQQFLDYGLITSAVTDVYDYGSVS